MFKGNSSNAQVSSKVHQQYQGTCYANAVATVVRAAQNRITGRIPDDHGDIVNSIIKRQPNGGLNGVEQGQMYKILQEECSFRHLRCGKIDDKKACENLAKNWPVLATFSLSKQGWSYLDQFFANNREGVLVLQPSHYGYEGHAVVISGQAPLYWKIKNSWGTGFGDQGFFRLAKNTSLNFYQVYFVLQDLTQKDRKAYEWSTKKFW